MFCAVTVVTADAMALGGSMAKEMIFSTTPTAADAVSPMVLMIVVIIRNETLTSASCRASGNPTFRIAAAGFLRSLK